MANRDIVVIGASAGGIETLKQLVGHLSADLPAAVFVVVHIAPEATSVLPAILNRAGPLGVVHPDDGDRIQTGRIYVARPDHHLTVKDGFLRVVNGPKENRHRPAIDPLFRTAARVYGPRVIGVILSGCGDDGVAGLRAIKTRGGIAIVQDPATALYPDLPRHAVEMVNCDHCRTTIQIAALLNELTQEEAPLAHRPVSVELDKEASIAELDMSTIEDDDKVGEPSAFSCPDCGGVLWEVEGEDLLRFRCRVGHAYSALALADEQNDALEKALWASFRSLEENSAYARRLALRARKAGHLAVAERFMDRAEEAAANSETVREMIMRFDAAKPTETIKE